MSKKNPVIALYGNVAMPRAYCDRCQGTAWVMNGKLACCDNPITVAPTEFIREISPESIRRRPGDVAKRKILAEQDGRCFYCYVQFGSIRLRNGKPFQIRLHWDHELPYAYSQNNKEANFVAACHVCNGIKSAKIFQTEDDARVYLASARKRKGYDW